ncbi:unnamed protein product [Rhizophagus irregularis]|nr:unnamed protein product [Rhizophagus irregularis]
MERWDVLENHRDPFVRTAEILPQLSARQLCHYWHNYLDLELCHHHTLDEEKKQLIDNWISFNRSKQ